MIQVRVYVCVIKARFFQISSAGRCPSYYRPYSERLSLLQGRVDRQRFLTHTSPRTTRPIMRATFEGRRSEQRENRFVRRLSPIEVCEPWRWRPHDHTLHSSTLSHLTLRFLPVSEPPIRITPVPDAALRFTDHARTICRTSCSPLLLYTWWIRHLARVRYILYLPLCR